MAASSWCERKYSKEWWNNEKLSTRVSSSSQSSACEKRKKGKVFGRSKKNTSFPFSSFFSKRKKLSKETKERSVFLLFKGGQRHVKTNCVPQIPLTGGWFPVNSRKRRRRSGAKKPLKSRAGTELSLARISLQQPLRALCLGENANTRLPRS